MSRLHASAISWSSLSLATKFLGLSNLFLHYVFDSWMSKNHPQTPWCRYADDGLAHCKTEQEAESLLLELKQRFEECKLELHSTKTKIVYCKDG